MTASSAIRWTEVQLSGFLRRHTQLPLGRGVEGLDKPKRIVTCEQEWEEAARLIRWVDGEGVRLYPDLGFFYAVPNGGFRHKAVAGKMKAQGVRAGVLDFNLDVARGPYHGLRIELKRRVGGTVSPAQKHWMAWLTGQGYLAVVCRGWQSARDTLVDYLVLEVK